VTGGSRGIGAAIVKRLASEGANVALTFSSSPDRAAQVVKEAQAFGVKALAIEGDSAAAARWSQRSNTPPRNSADSTSS